MCTIILLQGVVTDAPVVIAANRDELYARASRAPEVLIERNQRGDVAVGGQDLVHGGTWMGLTSSGFFAGLTNQKRYQAPREGLRSRGEVVLEALRLGERDEVRAYLETLSPRDYDGFNLLYGDGRGLEVAYGRPESRTVTGEDVAPGVHVLPNDRLDARSFPKVARARAMLGDVEGMRLRHLERLLANVLADHSLPPLEEVEHPPPDSRFDHALARQLQAVCIHTPHYGTRSASVIALGQSKVLRYLFADGPPCQKALDDRSPLLARTTHAPTAPADA